MCLFLLLCADGPEFVGLAHIILNLEGGQTFASTQYLPGGYKVKKKERKKTFVQEIGHQAQD